MIIFKKLPDGTWEKSGAILPTETHYRIVVDAEGSALFSRAQTLAHFIHRGYS